MGRVFTAGSSSTVVSVKESTSLSANHSREELENPRRAGCFWKCCPPLSHRSISYSLKGHNCYREVLLFVKLFLIIKGQSCACRAGCASTGQAVLVLQALQLIPAMAGPSVRTSKPRAPHTTGQDLHAQGQNCEQ